MRIKYNRVSTLQQTGNRFSADEEKYDETFLDRVSGTLAFKDRPEGKKIIKLVEQGLVKTLVVEEFSRLGRNTGDVINVLGWLEERGVNVIIKNLGIESRPNGKKNPIWKMISSVMSSLYELELENIKERTTIGRLVYVQNGGKLGRPEGTSENKKTFLDKPTSQKIIKGLRKGLTVREIGNNVKVSTKTVMKVKNLIANI
ncbi:recombinase family protein [Mucilaginibacter aquariorum]|uniref:Recombinase family protein n=1 Tax=Mucilaginibacter aquariorum TaxID=2967225 RepID=A0ABT1SZN4_9SPHI|nr:recombinase family protein [Mucilaginibacter aquariorum]MCQ6957727.1 recombinase family protein [Mucilaginibacter aquariorum]